MKSICITCKNDCNNAGTTARISWCPQYKPGRILSNADRIRAMDDKEISVLLSAVKFRRECFIKIPDFLSIQDAYKWLQQPAEEADHESNSEP